MAYDHFFKRLMKGLLRSCNVKANPEVGKLPLRIDILAECSGNGEKSRPISIFGDNLSKANVMEYKSSHDTPGKVDLPKLFGYASLYCEQNGIAIEEMQHDVTAWYVTAKHPRFIDEMMAGGNVAKAGISGLYRLSIPLPFPVFLLVIEDLEIKPEFFPLLLLAPEKKYQEILGEMALVKKQTKEYLDPGLENYLNLFYYFNYETVRNMTEMEDLIQEKVRRNIKMAIEDMGLERDAIEAIGLEKIIEIAGLEKLVETAGLEKLVETAGLEKLVETAGIEKVEKIIDMLKKKKKKS